MVTWEIVEEFLEDVLDFYPKLQLMGYLEIVLQTFVLWKNQKKEINLDVEHLDYFLQDVQLFLLVEDRFSIFNGENLLNVQWIVKQMKNLALELHVKKIV